MRQAGPWLWVWDRNCHCRSTSDRPNRSLRTHRAFPVMAWAIEHAHFGATYARPPNYLRSTNGRHRDVRAYVCGCRSSAEGQSDPGTKSQATLVRREAVLFEFVSDAHDLSAEDVSVLLADTRKAHDVTGQKRGQDGLKDDRRP
jgi:hypothetical protein